MRTTASFSVSQEQLERAMDRALARFNARDIRKSVNNFIYYLTFRDYDDLSPFFFELQRRYLDRLSSAALAGPEDFAAAMRSVGEELLH